MSRARELAQSLGSLFARLTQREQIAVIIMAVACFAFAAYLLIARPALAYQQAAERTLQADQARLARIMMLLDQAEGGQAVAIDRSKPARTRVLNAARQAGITIDQVEPQAEGFNVFVRGVAAADLFAWIADIENKQGVPVSSADISKSLDGTALDAEIGFGASR